MDDVKGFQGEFDYCHLVVEVLDLVVEPLAAPGQFLFTFAQMGAGQQFLGKSRFPVPMYIVAVTVIGAEQDISFDWSKSPEDPGVQKTYREQEVRQILEVRERWIGMVKDLVTQVEMWGKELGWSTRRIDQRLDDSYVGRHHVPALLMQEETFRMLLEPIGPSSLTAQGIVDLYQLPAYDDIARLFFYNGRWNVQYNFQGAPTSENSREPSTVPLSKEVLRKVVEEMRAHAA
jgi:hypothetical protein